MLSLPLAYSVVMDWLKLYATPQTLTPATASESSRSGATSATRRVVAAAPYWKPGNW